VTIAGQRRRSSSPARERNLTVALPPPLRRGPPQQPPERGRGPAGQLTGAPGDALAPKNAHQPGDGGGQQADGDDPDRHPRPARVALEGEQRRCQHG
jgi:hypothetical protein